jgi:hypothetical protein
VNRSGPNPPVGRPLVPALIAGLAWSATMLWPTPAAASTHSDPPAAACDLPSSTIVAGQSIELSGVTLDPDEMVGMLARKDTGESREGSVAVVNGRWRGVVLFGTADAGSWTIDVTVDGRDCVSPLTVTLPAGAVAPPTRPSVAATVEQPSLDGVDGGSIRSAAAIGAAGTVLASWILLLIVAVGLRAGWRPFARPRVRRVVQLGTFVAILGAFASGELVVYVMAAMSHFDTGLPSGQAAILDVGLWVAVVTGCLVGVWAARRLPGDERHAR